MAQLFVSYSIEHVRAHTSRMYACMRRAYCTYDTRERHIPLSVSRKIPTQSSH